MSLGLCSFGQYTHVCLCVSVYLCVSVCLCVNYVRMCVSVSVYYMCVCIVCMCGQVDMCAAPESVPGPFYSTLGYRSPCLGYMKLVVEAPVVGR